MDLLGGPEQPTRPEEKTPYVCDPADRWDGGPFLSYTSRHGLSSIVPVALRRGRDVDVPYTGLIHPLPVGRQHSIYTTWLFFGLLSEFVGLNVHEDGSRSRDEVSSKKLIDALYTDSVVTTGDGKEYLVGENVLQLIVYIRATLNSDSTSPQAHLNHFAECLRLTKVMLDAAHPDFDFSIRTAIAALGELLANMIQHSEHFTVGAVQTGFGFKRNYLNAGSHVRLRMLEAGWCKSDLSRADSLYQRLQTVHFLSLLDRKIPGRDHGNCTEEKCVAGQINNDTYKLSHDPTLGSCLCKEIEVDINSVNNILKSKNETFPVLLVSCPDDDPEKVVMAVEPFEDGVEYIAISHVWADGLGNTKANTLQRCQVARIGRLIDAVADDVHKRDPSKPPVKYRLWIDTLCVPVAPKDGAEHDHAERIRVYHMALGRMKDVYQQAAHVLVLDMALSVHDAQELHPATVLMRIFGSSLWMRRLWCLQEGVFANSLYFQFKDIPVHAQSSMAKLQALGLEDPRGRLISADIVDEFDRLDGSSTRPTKPSLYQTIQSALDYRAVTVPRDEAVCIATLFSLDLPRVLSVEGAADRMQLIWEMIDKEDGGIPALVIFSVDEPLPGQGFGWAPTTLLSTGDTKLTTGRRNLEYIDWSKGMAGSTVPKGKLTDQGLKVNLPGMMLESLSFCGDMPLHAWDGLVAAGEPVIYFQDVSEGKWYKMVDCYTTMGQRRGRPRQIPGQDDYDCAKDPRALCHAVDAGKIALIKSEEDPGGGAMLWLMVEINDKAKMPSATPVNRALPVRWLRKVIVSEVHGQEKLVARTFHDIAEGVAKASKELTTNFVRATENHSKDSEELNSIKVKLRDRLKKAVEEVWDARPDFADAVEQTIGSGMRDPKRPGDVIFTAVADEEDLSIGTEQVLAAGWRADAAIVCEPTLTDLVIAHKGFVWFEVSIHGVAAHGSWFDLGVDAIAQAGYFLVELDRYAKKLVEGGGHPALGRGSVHASVIKGGEEPASYPAVCTITVERRTDAGETVDQVKEEIDNVLKAAAQARPVLKYEMKVTFARSAFGIPEDHPLVKLLAEEYKAVTGKEIHMRKEAFWIDCALIAEKRMPVVMFGPWGEGLHSKKEWVEVDSLDIVANTLIRVTNLSAGCQRRLIGTTG